MARTKKSEPVITLTRKVLSDGTIRLSSPNGIIDTRNNRTYIPEVEIEPQNERFFKEAVNEK